MSVSIEELDKRLFRLEWNIDELTELMGILIVELNKRSDRGLETPPTLSEAQ